MCPFKHVQDGFKGDEGLGIVPRRGISGLSGLMFEIFGVIWILPFEGGPATLATGVRLVIARLVLIFALPLDLHGRLRVVRSLYLPAALLGLRPLYWLL